MPYDNFLCKVMVMRCASVHAVWRHQDSFQQERSSGSGRNTGTAIRTNRHLNHVARASHCPGRSRLFHRRNGMDERIEPAISIQLKGLTMQFIKNFIKEEDGVTAIEYALIASLIAGVIIAAVTLLGGNISAMFNALAGKISKTVK
jgi:pilus assembly protein Flp/PilA